MDWGLYGYVLVNSNVGFRLPVGSGSVMVQPEFDASERGRVILRDLVDKALPWRHDPVKLAAEVMRLYSSANARVPSPEE